MPLPITKTRIPTRNPALTLQRFVIALEAFKASRSSLLFKQRISFRVSLRPIFSVFSLARFRGGSFRGDDSSKILKIDFLSR